MDFERLKEGKVFQTKERDQLETDKDEVDYFMKKCACLRRKDNSWGKDKFNVWIINFDDIFGTIDTSDEFCIRFNYAYFHKDEHAQSCLDKLIEKYGESRLKECWGIK